MGKFRNTVEAMYGKELYEIGDGLANDYGHTWDGEMPDLENLATDGDGFNNYPCGWMQTKEGVEYFSISAGGDWQIPVTVIFFEESGQIKAHIPSACKYDFENGEMLVDDEDWALTTHDEIAKSIEDRLSVMHFVNEFSKAENDKERWQVVIKNSANCTVFLDNDSTVVRWSGGSRSRFHYFIGCSSGTVALLDAIGVKSQVA